MDNRLLAFAKLALAVAQRVLPERAHKFAPKTYAQPQLLACLLVKEYLHLDYRTAQEVLDASDRLRRILRLRRAPDYSTLWHFAQETVTPELIEQARTETVRLLQADSSPPPPRGSASGDSLRCVALDSTGLWTTHASRYFEWRRGDTSRRRPRRQRSWIKWAAALWTEPQLVVAQRVRRGPCGDFSDLIPLSSAASYERLLADAGSDSEANHRFCREELGVDSLIPAKKRRSARVIATTPYRREMVDALGPPGDPQKRRTYAQRWRVETRVSVVKRKWGQALSARSEATQRIQALLRGLVYNLYRLALLHVRPA
jgi:hypothetical protein